MFCQVVCVTFLTKQEKIHFDLYKIKYISQNQPKSNLSLTSLCHWIESTFFNEIEQNQLKCLGIDVTIPTLKEFYHYHVLKKSYVDQNDHHSLKMLIFLIYHFSKEITYKTSITLEKNLK